MLDAGIASATAAASAISREPPMIVLRMPLATRFTRFAVRPRVRSSRAATNSRAVAAKASSDGVPWPSQSRNAAIVSGSASATSGS